MRHVCSDKALCVQVCLTSLLHASSLNKGVIHLHYSRQQMYDHASSKFLCTCVDARRKMAVSVPEV